MASLKSISNPIRCIPMSESEQNLKKVKFILTIQERIIQDCGVVFVSTEESGIATVDIWGAGGSVQRCAVVVLD